MAANLSAFLLVGALAAFLAEQLQGARTKLRESETRLEALQTIYSAVVRSITSGIITVDQAGNVTYLNPAAEQLIGLADASARGQPLQALLPELAQSMVEKPAPSVRNEVKLKASDGRQRILGYAVAPLSGPLPGLVVLFQDLTDLRHMEETVRRSDRLAVVGGLAAGLAHEIRNPLASMCGSIEALGASPRLDAQERKLMGVVRDEAERLEALVRDFLSFARPASPSFENVPGARAIEETVDLFKSRPDVQGLDVLVNADDSLVLRADARQFRQVLWNLLGNAAEATQKGGKVEVKLGRQGAHALLEVSDSGDGIAQGDLGRIFDPFYTTKERGTGLGLAIVHRIVEAHGGELSVKSEQGRGSTFRVALPAVRPV
jgi:two-component system sensor histidine kinase PilS (NtrC family)